ncbi:MAG: NnrS family protein [Gammaproteobacteria bacterium]|nr:NnrS family protein [Gammaproteobacteria bacterium]
MKPRTMWAALTAEPYRILFGFGTLQLLAALLFWNVELIGRGTGVPAAALPWLPPAGIHGLLMLYAVFPFFVFGFLMTTYPRWLNAPPVPRARYLPAALLLGAGALVFYAGLYASATVTAAGLLVFLGGHLLAGLGLWETQRRGRIHGRLYERYLHIALLLGAVGILLAALALQGRPQLWPPARTLGLWGFLVPVLVTMSHRMLPFLTSCVAGTDPVGQPRGGPHAMLGLAALHGLLELAGQPHWLWLADLPLALIAAHHLRCWAFARCLRARLLAMFHIAFAWFVVGMLLYGIASLLLFLGLPDRLGRAPLHALGMGFALGMTLAMVTRIARVHIGLPPVAVAPVWLAFWALNGAVMLRIAAELIPLSVPASVSGVLLIAALLIWAAHCLPLLLKR